MGSQMGKIEAMPPQTPEHGPKTLEEIAEAGGVYPPEAYDFVRRGVSYTVATLYGQREKTAEEVRHVTGQQLCQGLRQFALAQWGLLAPTVLARWSVTSTFDFGRIVYELVDYGVLKTTEGDTLEDFRNVYDFRSAFESGYRIQSTS